MHAARVDVELVADQIAEPGAVEQSTRTDNPIHRPLRFFPREITHNIDRIRCNQQNAVRVNLEHFRNNAIENSDVALKQIDASLSFALRRSRCNDNNVGFSAILICTCPYLGSAEERHAVIHIERIPDGFLMIGVDQHELIHPIS